MKHCRGHRPSQQINAKNYCNGILECIDRSDETNCDDDDKPVMFRTIGVANYLMHSAQILFCYRYWLMASINREDNHSFLTEGQTLFWQTMSQHPHPVRKRSILAGLMIMIKPMKTAINQLNRDNIIQQSFM